MGTLHHHRWAESASQGQMCRLHSRLGPPGLLGSSSSTRMSVMQRSEASLFESARKRARASSVGCDGAPMETAVANIQPTPKKKGRGGGKGSPLAGASPANTSPGASSASDPATDNGTMCAEPGKCCYACDRVVCRDFSYLMPQQGFAWLYNDAKGNYCRDCMHLFRVAMKHSMGMNVALFGRWLSKPHHKLEWMGMLTAFLSLKFEGISHITLPVLQNREKVLKWVFDLLNIPWPSFVLVTPDPSFMKDLAESSSLGTYLCSTSDGQVMGLRAGLSPNHSEKSNARFVTKEQAKRVWPLLRWSGMPPQFLAEWEEHVGDMAVGRMGGETLVSPEEALAAREAIGEGEDDDEEPGAITAKGKGRGRGKKGGATNQSSLLESKVETLESCAKVLVESFCSSPDHLTSRLNSLAHVLTAVKALVRPLKDYMKSGRRSTLETVKEHIAVTCEWAEGKGIQASIELSACYIKAHFLCKQ